MLGTWSYSGDPKNDPKDAVRFEISDTDPEANLLSDEEIEYTLVEEASNYVEPTQGDIFKAAARCMETLARRFRAQADTSVGTLQTNYSRTALGYEEAARRLRAKATGNHAPFVGGQSETEKESQAETVGRVQSTFTKQQFKSPFAPLPALGPGPLTTSEGGI